MVTSLNGDLQQFLRRLTLRSSLTAEEEQAVLVLTGSLKQIPAHFDFVKQGQEVDHACLVVSGLAGRFGQNRDGTRQITCLHIPGDMADLPSVISPKAGWGLMALAPTTILRIPHLDLRRIAAQHSGIAEAFWRDCVADGSIFSEWVVNVGRRDAIARLAHLFCEMGVRSECAHQGDRCSFPLPITQNDLADDIGQTAVHVNRTLKKLTSLAVMSLKSGVVTVHDWERLAKIGDFDEAFLLLGGPSPRLS